MEQNNYLITEKPGKLMLKFAVPCVISLLVAALYNIVDQIFIGWGVGSEGNAATTVVFPLTVVALAIAVMIGDGTCAFVSISLGAKRGDDAHTSVGNAVLLSVISGVAVMLIYFVFMDEILVIFGAAKGTQTYEYAKEYFFYIILGIPFYMFGQSMNPVIRSDSSPLFAMVSTLAGAVLNVILDPIAIFVFKWGMMGAAVATVAGQVVTAGLSVYYLFNFKAVKIQKKSFKPSVRIIGKFIPLGICSFLAQISMVIAMAATNNSVRKYAALDPVFGLEEYAHIPLAVIGIVMKVLQIVMSVVIGMAAGCIPVVGFNIGAGRNDRAKKLFTTLLAAEACVGFIAFIPVEVFPKYIIAIFGTENAVYEQFAVRAFRIFLSMIVLACINKAAFIFLQSLGKPWTSTFLSLLSEVVLAVPLVYIVPVFFGLDGILLFMPVADVIAFMASVVLIIMTYRELNGKVIKAKS
ncbi:MAG: MATE family efflux transporter [Acutalibacteraceae bacterium]